MLISLWSVGLRSLLRRTTTPHEPQRISADNRARHLSEASNTQAPARPVSSVVPVVYVDTQQHNIPQPVAITDVLDTQASMEPIHWPLDRTQHNAWLRGNRFEVQLRVEPDKDLQGVQVTTDDPSITVLSSQIDIQSGGVARIALQVADKALLELYATYTSQSMAGVESHELRISTNSASATTNKVSLHLPQAAIEPLPPNLLNLRLGQHYPTRPNAAIDDLQVTLLKDVPHTLLYQLQTYSKTTDVLHLLAEYDERSNSSRIIQVGPSSRIVGTQANLAVPVSIVGQSTKLRSYFVVVDATRNHAFAKDQVTISQDANQPPLIQFDSYAVSGNTLRRNANDSQSIKLKLKFTNTSTSRVACRLFANGVPVSEPLEVATNLLEFKQLTLQDGIAEVSPRFFKGDVPLDVPAPPLTIDTRTGGFRIESITPQSFGRELGQNQIAIHFSRPLASDADLNSAIKLYHSTDGTFAGAPLTTGVTMMISATDPAQVHISLTPAAGRYQLRVNESLLRDAYGNLLDMNSANGIYVAELGGAVQLASADYPVTPGVSRGQAPFVQYPEFVEPRTPTKGFNPSDKVETRVSRLYFYRDAHRVAQILNRRVQSYNRQEVSVRRQLADKSRQEAESITTSRKIAERAAVEAAQRSRALENELSDTQRSLNTTLQQLQTAASGPPAATTEQQQRQQQILGQLENTARSFAAQAQTLESQIRAARDAEVAANERWQQAEREEQLARTEQFRLETSAAHADPDTFAAGDPHSIDPIAQVSISVIGEGLLHLRGPLKGVNQVRMMIDQIDAPQGTSSRERSLDPDQCRAEADKLEVVANRIQTYIDQARFLTVQSGEMLRRGGGTRRCTTRRGSARHVPRRDPSRARSTLPLRFLWP
ncbi:MAG: hypothetical protein R3C53_10750 [Pirellulaceae bacterium]